LSGYNASVSQDKMILPGDAGVGRPNPRGAVQQIADWLGQIGLGQYAQRFAENEIDVSVLRHLTDQDLKEMGVPLGQRRKMLAAIAQRASRAGTHRRTAVAAATSSFRGRSDCTFARWPALAAAQTLLDTLR
jgi:hypothetical protein